MDEKSAGSAQTGISREDVAHLAKLARIDLNNVELDHLAKELDVILGAVAKVREVSGADVAPTSHPIPVTNVYRDDVVKPSLTPHEALSGAPAQSEDRFKVPQILGEE
jgi:aspartyl-tRNA(Asn)/glutamyl-tRNA(Gln) amidotransferase subunit C